MFYRFTVPRDYPESTWVELWKLETAIHVSFSEHFSDWKSLTKGSLELAIRDCVNEWNTYYAANGGHTHISSYNLEEYLEAELNDIFRFVQDHNHYNGIPLHVDVFQACVTQSSDFKLFIEESRKRDEDFFNQAKE